MGFAGSSSPQGDAAASDPATGAMQFRKGVDSGQLDAMLTKERPQNWDQMSPEEQQAWTAKMTATYEGAAKQQLGQEYIAPGQTRAANAAPKSPDLTDDLLQKTRTNFAMRLQAGKSQKTAFAGTQVGGLSLSKPVLGGY